MGAEAIKGPIYSYEKVGQWFLKTLDYIYNDVLNGKGGFYVITPLIDSLIEYSIINGAIISRDYEMILDEEKHMYKITLDFYEERLHHKYSFCLISKGE